MWWDWLSVQNWVGVEVFVGLKPQQLLAAEQAYKVMALLLVTFPVGVKACLVSGSVNWE